MAEDMTYEPVTDVTTLAARVQELETALREQCELAATLMQQRTELEARLNATGFALANSALIQRVRELEAQLNAAIVGGAQLERENARLLMLNERIGHDELMAKQANENLRAVVAAIPVDALRFCVEAADYTYDVEVYTADEWLKTFEVQP